MSPNQNPRGSLLLFWKRVFTNIDYQWLGTSRRHTKRVSTQITVQMRLNGYVHYIFTMPAITRFDCTKRLSYYVITMYVIAL